MENYIESKREQIIKNNLIAEQKILLHKQKVEKILQNFEQNLKEVNKKEIDQRLIFYINTAYFLGLFKSHVKGDIFEKIMISKDLKEKLIELESINSVIDSLNKHTVFSFDKNEILNSFLNHSVPYLIKKILLRVSSENDDFHDCFTDFFAINKKLKRQLVENVKFPKKEGDRLLLEEYRLHKQKYIETTKNSPLPIKSFEYILGKTYSHPHRLAYQPLVYYIKELNEDLLQEAFNEKEFYVALYDLLKAISYDKEHYNDDDNDLIYISFNNDVKEYKSKIARNWFS